jgi:hypothetical protein
VEADEQRPTGPEYAVKVRQGRPDLVVGDVDQRVPGDQAGQRGIGEGEARHRADIEPETGVLSPCHLDHPGRQVDAERGQA